jgi:hypothetical protein
MLRNRIPDQQAQWPDPVLGVNLRDSLEDLQPGEAELLGNMFYDGGLRKRYGSTAITSASLGAFRGRGGVRVYPQTASKFRLVAYSTKVSTVSDTGTESVLTSALTSDQDVMFKTWSITDRTYICNKANSLTYVNATQVWNTISGGVNVPASPTMAVPFLDRLFAIQGDGVWSTNPRVDTVWSPNSSTWAIYRPAGGSGNPTALHLHSLTGNLNDPQAQMLIFQESSVTALTGADFGSDVTLTTPPTTWDAQLTLLSPNIGTLSPYSLVTVPGVGTFWFTQDANVAWMTFSSSVPQLIGDKLYSNRSYVSGINNVNFAQISQVRMVYHDRKLKLFLPIGSNAYSTVQYWLDLRQLQSIPALADKAKLSWSGPHTGQSLGAVWVESSQGDNNALYGTEGNSTTGMFVYLLNDSTTYKDAMGSLPVSVASDYRSFYHDLGAETFEKWIPEVRFDCSGQIENASVSLKDLHGNLVSGLTIVRNDGTAFTTNLYGNGVQYGNGYLYGSVSGQFIGHTPVESQSTSSILGDAIQVQVQHSSGAFTINSITPQAQIRRQVPVS